MKRIGLKIHIDSAVDKWGMETHKCVNDWFYCPEDQWNKICEFQAPWPQVMLNRYWRRDHVDAVLLDKLKNHIQDRMMAVGCDSLLWEMNLPHKSNRYMDPNGEWVRAFASMGEQVLVEWDWIDIYIIRPTLILFTKIMNLFKVREKETTLLDK